MKISQRKIIGIVIAMLFIGVSVAGVADAAKVRLRLQSHLPPDQMHRAFDNFVKDVDTMSGGDIKISIFPVNALVPMKEIMGSVTNRVVEAAGVPEGYWYKNVPVSIIAQGLPFAFKDGDEANFFMFQKGFVDLLRKGYAKHNIYVIPMESYNTGLMTKKPVTKAEDLKGMKLRAFGTMQKWLGNMGASTVSISGAELYTSLATGVVEGAHWADAGPMYEMKFHEILKNYMKPEPIIGSWNSIWFNMDVWKSLSKEQQAIIETAANGDCNFLNRSLTSNISKKALKDMVENWDVTVNTLSEEETEKMRVAGKKVWDEIAQNKDPLCKEAIDLLYEYLNEIGSLKK